MEEYKPNYEKMWTMLEKSLEAGKEKAKETEDKESLKWFSTILAIMGYIALIDIGIDPEKLKNKES